MGTAVSFVLEITPYQKQEPTLYWNHASGLFRGGYHATGRVDTVADIPPLLGQPMNTVAPEPACGPGAELARRRKMPNTAWYVLQTKPHQERSVCGRLREKGITAYLPCLAHTQTPYFPGYLFAQADLEETGLGLFNWLPGSKGLVQFGDCPATAPTAVIEEMKKRLSVYEDQIGREMAPGTAVCITAGPLTGYEGIVDRYLSGKERVVVLLSLLSHQTPRVVMAANAVTEV